MSDGGARASPKPRELNGGRYALLGKLGEGAQGETYEAIDNGSGAGASTSSRRAPKLADEWVRYVRKERSGVDIPRGARVVAIKCFRVDTAKEWKDVELAEREARTLASLDHPRLPKYFEHFEEDGALYLVMEKIEGESLAALRSSGRAMSSADVIRMLEDIADALRYLHGCAPAVVHRDIKPGNVIRRPDGSFSLVDFGAVRDRLKPAGGSTVVGTFGYMAPEQFQGRASPKSDVYGLAATALTMLTGKEPQDLPHAGLGIDVARALPRGTSGALVRALEAMLVPDPDGRVDSVDDALAILRETKEPKRRDSKKKARGPRLNRKQRRALEKQEHAATREQRARRRTDARARRPPIVARLLGRLGLLVALIVVWVTVGLAAPLVLSLLSLLFGASFRRAAFACVGAARRSQAALGRASRWLSGHRDESRDESVRVRVAAEHEAGGEPAVRVSDGGRDAELPAEGADAWMEERLEREAQREMQRERMRLHARPPTKRRFWGR